VSGPLARAGRSELWRIDVATGGRRRITPGDAVQPSWSPQGHRIAYWSVSSKSAERIVWTIPAAGGEPKRVTNDTFLNWSPVWSPDGRYLYYSSDRSGTPNIWRVPIDEASGEVRGTPEAINAPSESSSFMSFSADGRRMIYATDDGRSNLEKIGFDPERQAVQGELSAVTEGSRSIFAGEASPDGRWIAFQVTQPRDDLFVIQPDGSGLRQLTDDDAKDRLPRWSPDGSSILFYSNRSGRYGAWTIRPDGSGLEPLTVDTDEPLYNPLWSPDGKRIIFNLGFKSTALLELTDLRRRPKPLLLPRDIQVFNATSWSPDGRLLAGELPTPGIAVYSLDTGRLERMTESGSGPVWLADGRTLLYLERGRIFTLDLQSRTPRELLAPRANSEFRSVSPGPNSRTLFVVRATFEGDIWQRTN
jgi:Tol biopolymer transport system component